MHPSRTYTFRFLLLIVAAIAFAPNHACAQQEDPLLSRFSLQEDDGNVFLDWTTRPGTTCDGVDVLRSTDSLNFYLLHHIAGICGGPNDSYSYSFLDESPVPNFRNYYRLGLGRTGESQVRGIDIVQLGATGYQVRPNPITDHSQLYFDNGAHSLCTLSIIDLQGVTVQVAETRDDHFTIDASSLRPQIHAFKILNNEGKPLAQGRFLIGR